MLLFELLTGTKPHAGDSPIQVAYKHVHDDVPAPSSRIGGIPPYLDAFVARATARRRDLRPADAHVMLQQLRRVRQALDDGITEDAELTLDLTPTIAVTTGGDDYRAPDPDPASADRTGGELDAVFDIDAYDDFASHPGPAFVAPGGYERTLVVGAEEERGELEAGPEWQRLARASSVVVPPDRSDPAATKTTSPRPRRRRLGWIVAVLVIALAIAAGIGGWWYGVARFQSTPDVVRMTQAEARDRLQSAGLELKSAARRSASRSQPGTWSRPTLPRAIGFVIRAPSRPWSPRARNGTTSLTWRT